MRRCWSGGILQPQRLVRSLDILNTYIPLFVLDLDLNVIDGVRGLNLQRDGLPSECLDKDLHAIARRQLRVQVKVSEIKTDVKNVERTRVWRSWLLGGWALVGHS